MTIERSTIPLDAVRTNGGTQSRVSLCEATIAEYAEAIRGGTDLPAVIAFFDGKAFWLADGFHRLAAHKMAGAMEIDAEIHTGTKRDAILYSVGANYSHGLRRTNDDKRQAVLTLLSDKEWSEWSDREIAVRCGVSHPFVAAIRSPEVAVRQQENRKISASSSNKVESDSTSHAAVDAPKVEQIKEHEPQIVATPRPAPVIATVDNVDVEALRAEIESLKEHIAQISEDLRTALADNEMMGKVFDADDRLKAAMAEIERHRGIAESAERTLAAKSGEFVERAKAVKLWQGRAERAEKKLAKLEVKK